MLACAGEESNAPGVGQTSAQGQQVGSACSTLKAGPLAVCLHFLDDVILGSFLPALGNPTSLAMAAGQWPEFPLA